jgi:hypothetical protein
MSTGELKAWENLKTLAPADVCSRSGAHFSLSTQIYSVHSFNMDFNLSLPEQSITGDDIFMKRLGYFFRLSALCYLNTAKDIPPTGRLIKPSDIKGGQLFFRGSHVLPLDGLAAKYGVRAEDFLHKGVELGAETAPYGDAALRFLPFPKIPVYLILWKEDEEFPARTDLLFDSVCEIQAPLDILWSIAMMTILAMMM